MSLIPDTALFLFPTGPHALAVHWPQAGAGSWNCRAVPLGYMVPFRKLSFHFQFPFIFFYLLREDVGVENKWVLVSKYDFP